MAAPRLVTDRRPHRARNGPRPVGAADAGTRQKGGRVKVRRAPWWRNRPRSDHPPREMLTAGYLRDAVTLTRSAHKIIVSKAGKATPHRRAYRRQGYCTVRERPFDLTPKGVAHLDLTKRILMKGCGHASPTGRACRLSAVRGGVTRDSSALRRTRSSPPCNRLGFGPISRASSPSTSTVG